MKMRHTGMLQNAVDVISLHQEPPFSTLSLKKDDDGITRGTGSPHGYRNQCRVFSSVPEMWWTVVCGCGPTPSFVCSSISSLGGRTLEFYSIDSAKQYALRMLRPASCLSLNMAFRLPGARSAMVAPLSRPHVPAAVVECVYARLSSAPHAGVGDQDRDKPRA